MTDRENPPNQPEETISTRQSDSGRVARNVLANYAGTAVMLIVAFLLTPFLVSRLGHQLFGLWVLIGGVMAYGSMLDLGMDSAVVKYVSEHTDLDDIPSLERIVQTSLAVYLGIGAAVLLFTAAATFIFPLVFRVPTELVGASRALLMIAGVSLALNFPLGMYNGVLLGLQRHHVVMVADIAWASFTALGAVVVISAGGGVVGLALVYLSGSTLGQAVRIGYLMTRHPDIRWVRIRLDTSQGRKLFSFSLWSLMLRVSTVLRLKTDEMVIGASLSLGSVTPYYVGMRLSEMLSRLTGQLTTALFPFGSRLDALHDRTRLSELFVAATRWNLAIAAPMALFLGIQAPRFLEAWMGPGFSSSAAVARLLISAAMCSAYMAVGYTFLKSTGQHQAIARWSLVEALVNLGLSVILVRKWGVTGVAAGTAIPAVLFNFGFVLPHACRRLGVPVSRLLRGSLVPQLPAAAGAVAVSLALALVPGGPSLVRLLAEAVATGATYWTMYYLLGAHVQERLLLRRFVSGLGNRA